ncbi:MAG: hypothetical protein ABSG90_05535 [Dehalococcoidia bacterium]|jgi:hypothetical protein
MWNNIVGKHIKRTNRNLLIVNILVLIGGVWILLPWLISALSSGADAWGWIMLIVLIAIVSITTWNFIKFAQRNRNPEMHPVAVSLMRWDPCLENTISSIEEAVSHTVFQTKSIVITPYWILIPTLFGLHIFHPMEIAWAYCKKTTHVLNFILPIWVSHQLVIYFGQIINLSTKEVQSNKPALRVTMNIVTKSMEFGCNETDATKILNAIYHTAKPVLIGFKRDWKNEWEANSTHMFASIKGLDKP